MMKKMVTLLAAAMLTLSASSAFAAFADMDLVRVYYERNTGTVEQVTNLGNVNTLIGTTNNTIAGSFGTVSNQANLFAVYYAINPVGTGASNDLWVSGSTTTAPVAVGTLGFNTTKSGWTNNKTYWNVGLGGTTTVLSQISNSGSYSSSMSSSQGALSNAINGATRPFTEASLASLDLVNGTGSVTQALYFFNNPNTANAAGVQVATIQTNGDGSTTINPGAPSAVPIPAAAYLLGSGLMGLVGIRRKMNK